MNKYVLEEEKVKLSHPLANGKTLSAGNNRNCLYLLSEVDSEQSIGRFPPGRRFLEYRMNLQWCSEDMEGWIL